MNDVILNHHLELALGIFLLVVGGAAGYALWIVLGPREKR